MNPRGPVAQRAAQRENDRIQQQRDAMKRLRQEQVEGKVRDRVSKLKLLQRHDLQVDKALLFDAAAPIPACRLIRDLWFASKDMDGDPNAILQWLGALVRATVPKEKALDDIDDFVGRNYWKEHPFVGHPNDKVNMSATNSTTRRVEWLSRACKNPDDPNGAIGGKNPKGNDRTWEKIRHVFEALDDLKVLERFIDPRNPEMNQKPLPDGTNLESGVLRSSWVLHRAWIRALHYRSLYAGSNSHGWDQVQQILKLVAAFGQLEHLNIPRVRLIRPEFDFLYSIYRDVVLALGSFVTELHRERRPSPADGDYSEAETIFYNMQHGRFENLWVKSFASVNKIFILWSQLLRLARAFETAMDVEHVEDVLVDKRVVYRDEWYDADMLLDGTTRHPDFSGMQTNQGNLYGILAEISRINRHRRNFLLLRDWSKKRPWHQLYYVFNTADGEQDYLLRPIADFFKIINDLALTDPAPPFTGPSPSRTSNVWASLFTLHPIASTQPTQHHSANFDEPCPICADNFAPAEIVVQLHCKHLMHYLCIREYWDFPGRQLYRCPLCNAGSVNWLLHEQSGITPEVLDVWDHEEVADPNWAREHPDFEDQDTTYWGCENAKLALSRNWVLVNGPQDPRAVSTEMARVRENRRKRNKERREDIARAKTGVAGLAPPPPGASANNPISL